MEIKFRLLVFFYFSSCVNTYLVSCCHCVFFQYFLFAEAEEPYDGILDETWNNEYSDVLYKFNLIILDNYHSLYDRLNPIKLINWMKKFTREGVAFFMLDHTNSEGELQGSQVKKRAADLGFTSFQFVLSLDIHLTH